MYAHAHRYQPIKLFHGHAGPHIAISLHAGALNGKFPIEKAGPGLRSSQKVSLRRNVRPQGLYTLSEPSLFRTCTHSSLCVLLSRKEQKPGPQTKATARSSRQIRSRITGSDMAFPIMWPNARWLIDWPRSLSMISALGKPCKANSSSMVKGRW